MEKYTFKVNYKINGQWAFSVFCHKTKESLDEAINQWKAEHVTPYNKIEILWHGTLDQWEEEQKSSGLYDHIKKEY
jgi:hypothetical protein